MPLNSNETKKKKKANIEISLRKLIGNLFRNNGAIRVDEKEKKKNARKYFIRLNIQIYVLQMIHSPKKKKKSFFKIRNGWLLEFVEGEGGGEREKKEAATGSSEI